ncbi:MAG: NAD-dependent epimerase/dehydratase family protein [Planctomycetes bacterium]|nr:NAD-dependent epimerase/dehydratase family protein [Planctomycetota bacterium]
MRILITGSSGLVGSEVAEYFLLRGHEVHGVDNNQRAVFFGQPADTSWRRHALSSRFSNFTHHEVDIRDREAILVLVGQLRPQAIVHAAAQPSHDRAAQIPFDDFDTNATGTLNLLEAARRFCPDYPFVHMSTNKVYGDRPNTLPLKEEPTRWEFADARFIHGIDEDFPVDQCLHSLFGASKLAADILVQEYGRYFEMPTCCLRAGCITGPSHSGVELHGFLSYLVKCNLSRTTYRIFGYKGKQVRDNLHAQDLAFFIELFLQAPRVGEVYNIGGGKENSCSILEAFELVESLTGIEQRSDYTDQARKGDHICYYTNLGKVRAHFPQWTVTKSLQTILEEIVESWRRRLDAEADRRK